MKLIALNLGKFAKVDDEDYARFSGKKWCVMGSGYAGCWEGGRKNQHCVMLHREILGLPHSPQDGIYVDHVNRDKLDNRRLNLRVSSKAQNSMNRLLQKNNTSGFRGVRFMQGAWQAVLKRQGKQLCLGTFPTVEEAAACYREHAEKAFGEFYPFS